MFGFGILLPAHNPCHMAGENPKTHGNLKKEFGLPKQEKNGFPIDYHEQWH